jgi:hypothetical protein
MEHTTAKPAVTAPRGYNIIFADPSVFGANVVFAEDAPVVEVMWAPTHAEAFEYALAFSDEFQVSIVPVAEAA